MRITYRQLKMYLDALSPSQLDCDVTYEDEIGECFVAGFEIAGSEHGAGLEEYHPIILSLDPMAEGRFLDEDVREDIKNRKERGDFADMP